MTTTSSRNDSAVAKKELLRIVEFSVLYFKRCATSKVHKAKGVSKADGTLTIDLLSEHVTLCKALCDDSTADSSADEGDGDDTELEKLSWNQRRQMQCTKSSANHKNKRTSNINPTILYSGINRDLVQRYQCLVPEDIVSIGSYDVEIVCRTSAGVIPTEQKPLRLASKPTTKVLGVKRVLANSSDSVANKKSISIVGSTSARKIINLPSKLSGATSRSEDFRRHSIKKKATEPSEKGCVPSNDGTLSKGFKNSRLLQPNAAASKSKTIVTQAPLQQRKAGADRNTVDARLGGNDDIAKLKGRTVSVLLKSTSQLVSKKKPSIGIQKMQPRMTTSQNIVHSLAETVLPHIPLLASIRNVLLPHQVTGVDFLWNSLVVGPNKGAILADEMGLGKTLMTVAIIAAMHRRQRDKQFVVVCPSSLVSNWAAEFDKWVGRASQPKCVIINKGGVEGVQQMKAFYHSCSKQQTLTKTQSGQVLIVSYDLFRRNATLFCNQEIKTVDDESAVQPRFANQGKKFGLIVVDEGHRLKNTKGSLTLTALEALPTDARLCITATPIQNNLSEFYTLANFACPQVLGDLSSFRRDFERPIASSNDKRASIAEREIGLIRSVELERISKSFMLRRLQKEVLTDMLPSRTEMLLFCQPSMSQCNLYQQITRAATSGPSPQDALTALTALRKVCSHPSLYRHGSNDSDDENCDYAKSLLSDAVAASGKLVVLRALLDSIRKNDPNGKVVIVSNYTSALSIIEKMILNVPSKDCAHEDIPVEKSGFTYLRLDGSVDNGSRKNMVDSFNRSSADRCFCLLLSAKAGGCGLNLVGANRLVLFDPDWNPATDIQAMGRIYRQGQTKPCTIYRMFTGGTLEEVIYQRQSQKGDLATLTVDGAVQGHASGSGLRFSKEELADCFTLKLHCDCDTKNKIGKHWPAYDIDDPSLSLKNQGCVDQPMLHVVASCKNTLRFVHLVTTKATVSDSPAKNASTASADHVGVQDLNRILTPIACEQDNSMSASQSDSSEEEFEL